MPKHNHYIPYNYKNVVQFPTSSCWRSWTSGRRGPSLSGSPAGTAGCCPRSATARSGPASCPLIEAISRNRQMYNCTHVYQVNLTLNSIIGRVKFRERCRLSVHQALALARRLLGCSERTPRLRVAPVGNGVQVAFSVPARKRVKHVWTQWGVVLAQLGPALAAQHRLGKRRRRPNPVQAVARDQPRGFA